MHIISRSGCPQADTLASLTDLKLMKQRIHTIPGSRLSDETTGTDTHITKEQAFWCNGWIHLILSVGWNIVSGRLGVSKNTDCTNIENRATIYVLCMVCGGSGRSNESTTDTLRNQGTKSQGRFFQREKELVFHFFETLPLDLNVPFDGATRSLGGILEESWVQYFSVNWPGLHVNYF